MIRKKYVIKYFDEIERALRIIRKQNMQQIERIVDAIHLARIGRSVIYICGNGGSASTASHFACDLSKRCGLKAVSLADSMSIITAYADDEGYPYIFTGQLESFLNEGDTVIGISGSGNSKNVLGAINYANSERVLTIGLTGFKGGRLKKVVDIALVVPSNNMQQIENVHLILCHLISSMVMERIKK